MADFKIEGLDAAMAKLRAVSKAVAGKATRSAATKAMAIVRNAARATVAAYDDPDSPSNIAKNIVTRNDTKAGKREGGIVVKVGVAGGAKPQKGNKDTGHWRFVEFGKEGVAARPFMRPALEGNVDAVTNKFVSELEPAIDKAILKATR